MPSRGYYWLLRSILCHLWGPGCSNFDNPAWWSLISWEYHWTHLWPAWVYPLLFEVILIILGALGIQTLTTQPGSLPALGAISGFLGPSWGYPRLLRAILHHPVGIVGYSGPFSAISGALGLQTLTTQPGGILGLGAIFGFCQPSLGYRGGFRAIL